MTNSKTTKRALLSSAFAIMLCAAMLIGTTFAWFTDTASTGVNKIVSGKLKVGLEYAKAWDNDDNVTEWDNAEGKTLNFKKAKGHETEEILWEPGCRYELPELRVVNNGNLALKYKIQITGIQGDAKLNEVINWTIGGAELGEEYHLTPTDKYSNPITIVGEMRTDANNDYQDLSIDGIGITVYATQDTVEYDSYGNQYDAGAEYPTDADALSNAMSNGGNIILGKDIDVDKTMIANGEVNLNLAGKTLSNSEDIWKEQENNWSLISAQNGANLVIDGNGTVAAKENDCFAVDVQDGSTVTIKNGKFIGNIHAVYVYSGKAVIEGGFFEVQQKYPDAAKANEFVLNCYDANRANGTAEIIVKGGTFVNFNPADCFAEGAHTNFVAAGYTVKSEAHGSDTWYTVVPVTASSNEELANLISANSDVTVKLDNGTYKIPSELQNKSLTVTGTKDTVIDVSTGAAYRDANIVLEGVTVKGQTNGDFQGLMHTKKVVYKDCKITGKQTLYANDVEFINCEFDSGADYALWTYGAKNVTFTDCKFNSTNNGKSVLCYSVLKDQTFTRTFNRCTFTATGTKDKSAIMINPTESSGGKNTYIININDCTATGYKENGITGQTIVGLRNAGAGVIDTITVKINGTTVYTH